VLKQNLIPLPIHIQACTLLITSNPINIYTGNLSKNKYKDIAERYCCKVLKNVRAERELSFVLRRQDIL